MRSLSKRIAFGLLLLSFVPLYVGCIADGSAPGGHSSAVARPIKSLFHTAGGPSGSDSLYPIHPNPFSRVNGDSNVFITFATADTSQAIVLIQNPIGDEIVRYTDSMLPPGLYPGLWSPVGSDGEALDPGLYFVTLRITDSTKGTSYISSRLLNLMDN